MAQIGRPRSHASHPLYHTPSQAVTPDKIPPEAVKQHEGILEVQQDQVPGLVEEQQEQDSTIAAHAGRLAALEPRIADLEVAPPAHIHDDRYYTEGETDARYVKRAGGTVTGNDFLFGQMQWYMDPTGVLTCLGGRLNTDSFLRWLMDARGRFEWGGGAGARNVFLEWESAGRLKLTGTLNVTNGVQLNGIPVELGPPDSAGPGYRALRIPN